MGIHSEVTNLRLGLNHVGSLLGISGEALPARRVQHAAGTPVFWAALKVTWLASR
jgi:hypothetical protein